ncbi:YrhK family protein [Sulfitobacter albidus]|uniref:YrhK family protein n=1 Tax=Sulfitobacter albidus TaxID=2829501 RepID=A0A975PLJ7_9RHOB|nr:YrhK family protein [Sulfitobacter albidus]QUJ75857.1 YrhK family protein [Sulfitobacter albidus]
MTLFHRSRRHDSDAHRKLYARFELAYTVVDFTAALLFVVGSVMFFSEAWQTTGTWLFLIGSLCFAAKPTLRLLREVRLYRMGDAQDLAERFED